MATNKEWCRIIDDGKRIEFFPGWVEIDGRIWINPSDEQKARAGWLWNAKNAPGAREGYVARVERYEAREGQIYAVYAYDAVTPPPRVFSKLKLLMALGRRNLTGAFLAWVEESGYEPMWQAAQDLSEDFEGFDRIVSAVRSALNMTADEVEAVLGEAVV